MRNELLSFTVAIGVAVSLILSTLSRADESGSAPVAAPVEAKDTGAAQPAVGKKKYSLRPGESPFYGFVTVVDATARKFFIDRAGIGTIAFVYTERTIMRKNHRKQKMENLKVGDFVRGHRLRLGVGEWEVTTMRIIENPNAAELASKVVKPSDPINKADAEMAEAKPSPSAPEKRALEN